MQSRLCLLVRYQSFQKACYFEVLGSTKVLHSRRNPSLTHSCENLQFKVSMMIKCSKLRKTGNVARIEDTQEMSKYWSKNWKRSTCVKTYVYGPDTGTSSAVERDERGSRSGVVNTEISQDFRLSSWSDTSH